MNPGNKVTLAFYKDGKSSVSRFIRRMTGSHYSHVEIILGTVWVTALIGEGVAVRRYVPGDHKEKYDLIDVEVDSQYWHETIEFINSIEKDGMYDFLGAIFGDLMHIPFIQDPNKWFCSEVVASILEKLHDPKIGTMGTSLMTPEKLYKLYKD